MAGTGPSLTGLPLAVFFSLLGCDLFYAPGPGSCDQDRPCMDPARPRCDVAAGRCMPAGTDGGATAECGHHSECASGVCDQFGAVGPPSHCLDPADVVTVQNGGDLAAALVSRHGIRLASGTYAGRFDVTLNRVVLVGPDSVTPAPPVPPTPAVLVPASMGPVLHLGDQARVTVDGVAIHAGQEPGGHGIFCETADSQLWVRRAEISGNQGRGIWARCPAWITQSRIGPWDDGNSPLRNVGGGVLAESDLTLTNTFVTNNGSDTSTVGGVVLRPLPQTTPRYLLAQLTFVGNLANVAGLAVDCGPTPVTIWQGLFWQNENAAYDLVTGRCAMPAAAVDAYAYQTGSTVALSKDMPPRFRGPQDYHLLRDSPAVDAVPNGVSGAPALLEDYDGDSRPIGPARDYGADEVLY